MIERSSDGDIAIIRLSNGPVNVLDGDLMRALADALDDAERSDVPALVLSGSGTVFSAGADLLRILDEGPGYLTGARPQANRAFERLFTFPRPVVAAVNGHAIAGGCVLALACDHRVAASGNLRVGLPELRVGVPFPVWALETVRFALAPPHLQRLITSGKLCTVTEAFDSGLVDEVVDPDVLLTRAVQVAARLAAIPRATYALTKRALREPFAARARGGGEADEEGFGIWVSEDARAAMQRFVERTLGGQSGA